jgi:hypothetical protein
MSHVARASWRERETIRDASVLIIAKLYCWNFDSEFRNGKGGTQNKQAQHPEYCVTVRNTSRSAEDETLRTGIPEMSGMNLGQVSGYFVSNLWFCKLRTSC